MLIKVNERLAEHGAQLLRRDEQLVNAGGVAKEDHPAEGTT